MGRLSTTECTYLPTLHVASDALVRGTGLTPDGPLRGLVPCFIPPRMLQSGASFYRILSVAPDAPVHGTHPSERDRKKAHPSPTKQEKQRPPNPRTPPDSPGKPGPSILVILPPIITTPPPGPGVLIILPPATSSAPTRGVPRVRQGRKGPAALPHRPHGQLDLVLGHNPVPPPRPGGQRGPQIRVIWHRQKKVDQGSSAPDKPEGHTLELNSAHPIRLRTDENKAHRGTKYTGELPPEWSQGLPPPRLPKRQPPGKTSPGPGPRP